MTHKIWLVLLFVTIGSSAMAADKNSWYEKAVKSVTASIEPASAKPGQTVTFKLTVTLNEGYHTYPLKQVDDNAKGMINSIAFGKPENLIFVGTAQDPAGYDTKMEPILGIMELRTYKNVVTFERKAVVSPRANTGEQVVKLESFKLNICDETNCFPTKTLTPEAKFKVQEGQVEVAKEYADEVNKSLNSK